MKPLSTVFGGLARRYRSSQAGRTGKAMQSGPMNLDEELRNAERIGVLELVRSHQR